MTGLAFWYVRLHCEPFQQFACRDCQRLTTEPETFLERTKQGTIRAFYLCGGCWSERAKQVHSEGERWRLPLTDWPATSVVLALLV